MNPKDKKRLDALWMDMLLGVSPSSCDDWKLLFNNCAVSDEAESIKRMKKVDAALQKVPEVRDEFYGQERKKVVRIVEEMKKTKAEQSLKLQ